MASHKPTTVWRAHSGQLAVPTLILAAFVVVAFAVVMVLGLAGGIELWTGMLVNTVLAYFAFTPMHEASHGNVSGKHRQLRWLNEAVGWLCGAVMLAGFPAFKALHLRHHSHTNDPDLDVDHWVAGKRPLGIFLRCATIFPRYHWEFLFGETSRSKSGRDSLAKGIGAIILFIGITAYASVEGYGIHVLFLWWIPAQIAFTILAFTFDWLPHYPHTNRGRYLDTRVYLLKGLRLLTLWQNYHLIHHLYPRVPFYRYDKVFEAEREFLLEKGATIKDWTRP